MCGHLLDWRGAEKPEIEEVSPLVQRGRHFHHSSRCVATGAIVKVSASTVKDLDDVKTLLITEIGEE